MSILPHEGSPSQSGDEDLTVRAMPIVGLPRPRDGLGRADEVLPSRHQSYPEVPKSFAEALELAAAQQREIEAAQSRIAELEPAAEQFHRWQFSGDTVYVVEWAKTLGMTQQEAFEALRGCGALFKQQHEGAAFNVPKRGYERYFVLVDEWLPAPRKWTKVPKITAEGQVFLAELLLERGWIAP